MNPFEHMLMFIITMGLIIMLSLFLISTILGYLKQKQITALYLGLVYLFFIITFVLFILGHLESFFAGGTTIFYTQISFFANAFSIIGIIFLVLFHSGFADVKKLNKRIEIAIGIFVTIWILLPFNYIIIENNYFKYTTYAIMTAYGLITYAHLGYSFLKIAKKSTMRRKELNIMGIGSIIFLFYFVIILVFAFTQYLVFIIMGIISLYGSFFCYFLGIYLPKLRSK